MIGLDSNVLLRFIVQDDEAQHRRVTAFFRSTQAKGEACFISDVVLVEVVWVLERTYRQSAAEVARVVDALLESEGFVFESIERLRAVRARLDVGRAGFADYLIAERGRDAGCSVVVTFDAALLREEGFEAP